MHTFITELLGNQIYMIVSITDTDDANMIYKALHLAL